VLACSAMSTLKFIVGRDSHLTATVPTGRYLIVDYGREGFDATFTPTGGTEIALPPPKGGRFHKASRHAMATCELHLAHQAASRI
jgi:hypothetical protein